MQQLNIYGNFFGGFFAALVLPFVSGIFLGIRRAMWSSAD